MTVVLICNVGNRDVALKPDGAKGLPKLLQDDKASRRDLGRYLQERFVAYQSHIEFPIINPIVAYLLANMPSLDGVVLIVSNQPEPPSSDPKARGFWGQDTCELAAVIRTWLIETYHLRPDQVAIKEIRQNPADYGVMHTFLGELLPEVKATYPDGRFYLALSGGTPAMNAMLLVQGTEILGEAAVPLYLSPQHPHPFVLNVGQKLLARSLRSTLRRELDLFNYHAALDLLTTNTTLLRDDLPDWAELVQVIRYARERLNFNFAEAAQAISYPPQARLKLLADEIASRPPEWLLAEVAHAADIKLRTGQYADFLGRVFRFHEAALRLMAQQRLGIVFEDDTGKRFDLTWLSGQADLKTYLDKKGVRYKEVNRYVLELANRFIAERNGDQAAQEALGMLDSIKQLADLRNHTPLAHNYEGVSRQRLAAEYHAAPEQILRDMATIYKQVTGQPLGRNPYEAINELCLTLGLV